VDGGAAKVGETCSLRTMSQICRDGTYSTNEPPCDELTDR
jgi:hypothetical protein